MFARHSQLLDLVAEIMGTAPALAEWLGTHPQVLDGVISRDFFGRLPKRGWLEEELAQRLRAARDYQDILDITRRWAREKRFHAGIHILQQRSPPADTAGYLSDIAEAALRQLTPAVETEFAKAHGRIAGGSFILLAMGSFAARRMFTDSDLDIVALYDVPENVPASGGEKPLSPSQYYIRLTQRLITAITAPTSESILYSVDARLRPAGNDGPLAVSLDGFLDYHEQKAWTWEHMSLIRHRVIYGEKKSAAKLARGIAKILTSARDADLLCKDILDMQTRVRREFGQGGNWDLKYRKGGLMDQLFAVQYLQLKHAAQNPAVLEADLAAAIRRLVAARALKAAEAKILSHAQERVLAVQMFLRLSASLPFDPRRATAGLKIKMTEILNGKPARTRPPKNAFETAVRGFLGALDAADQTCRRILHKESKPAKKKRAPAKAKKRGS